jgi:hypothetical protein
MGETAMSVFVVMYDQHYEGQDAIGVCRSLEAAKRLAQEYASRHGDDAVLAPFEPGTIYNEQGFERVQRLVSKGLSRDYEIIEYKVRD